MIKLGLMKWSNCFSYGEDNSIDFSKNELLQLIGKNGHGKSSVALVLEEVLYNKNSKGIKKADILNRYVDAKSYSIQLSFTKEAHTYEIRTVRGTTQTVKLLCDGSDISSHTSTGTYKLIEDIIGFDHKTFTQIVYQSSTYSLEFLVATDTNRKKFLIDLLNLSIYTKASELFKGISKEVGLDCDSLSVKVKTVNDWLTKFSKEPLTKMDLLDAPDAPTEAMTEAAAVKEQLNHIDSINKKIIQNNKYKEILNTIVILPAVPVKSDLTQLKIKQSEYTKTITKAKSVISGNGSVSDNCTMCGQPVDNSHKKQMVVEARDVINTTKELLDEVNLEIKVVEKELQDYTAACNTQTEWEKYHSLIDHNLSDKVLDRAELIEKLLELSDTISDTNDKIAKAVTHNSKATANNTRVDVLLSQIETMGQDMKIYSDQLGAVSERLSTLQVLQKTFSTTGLVAYKIECLVKDLEQLTNDYLLDMSDGRFQISFKVNSSDKLNVIITDNGHDIDILALSNGERARVNVATLLAIRKLMQSLSNSRINLLILDETVENLDVEGKEKLIEILLNEEYLNTILISHGFTHPLLEKISIVKENSISRME